MGPLHNPTSDSKTTKPPAPPRAINVRYSKDLNTGENY